MCPFFFIFFALAFYSQPWMYTSTTYGSDGTLPGAPNNTDKGQNHVSRLGITPAQRSSSPHVYLAVHPGVTSLAHRSAHRPSISSTTGLASPPSLAQHHLSPRLSTPSVTPQLGQPLHQLGILCSKSSAWGSGLGNMPRIRTDDTTWHSTRRLGWTTWELSHRALDSVVPCSSKALHHSGHKRIPSIRKQSSSTRKITTQGSGLKNAAQHLSGRALQHSTRQPCGSSHTTQIDNPMTGASPTRNPSTIQFGNPAEESSPHSSATQGTGPLHHPTRQPNGRVLTTQLSNPGHRTPSPPDSATRQQGPHHTAQQPRAQDPFTTRLGNLATRSSPHSLATQGHGTPPPPDSATQQQGPHHTARQPKGMRPLHHRLGNPTAGSSPHSSTTQGTRLHAA